tara:strand:- start:39019 stop:39408 length:390 start_codon:yes stop_codon:yes gene_type:complete
MSKTMEIYEVSVQGFGTRLIHATSSAKAKYDAYLSDVFSDMQFRDFLKIVSARKHHGVVPDGYTRLREQYPSAIIPAPGTRIAAEGMRGTVLAAVRPTAYVVFQPDLMEREAFVHPMSVQLLAEAEGVS